MIRKISALALALSAAASAQAALTAGDIAIIGRTNNGTPDAFSFVALSNIAAGEVIYFTDNGWTGSGFRSGSTTDGDGNENLTKWTAANNIAAGTIIASTSAGFSTAGSVPGAASGSFASLALSTTGDQIYAFQNTNSNNPLHNTATQTHLYVLDDTNGFEVATSSNQGDIAPGLTLGVTAVTVNFPVSGVHTLKASFFSQAHTQAEWLGIIGNASNWAVASALPTGSLMVTPEVPEPSTYAIALAGLAVAGSLARRRKVV